MKTQEAPYGLSLKKEWALRSSFRYLLWFSGILFLSLSGVSQTCTWYPVAPAILLDTLPVDPASINVSGLSTGFTYDPGSGLLTLHAPSGDSVEICFRTIHSLVLQPFYKRDIKTYSSGRVRTLASATNKVESGPSFGLSGFDSYGSISRGVGFGNRQNVFVNSALNLQLDGQLTDNLYVSASITDQNIPYQPEGNTQQIRDFDNVYIKFYNDDFDLTMGDIVFTNPVKDSYFLKYYKNVQGLQVNTTQKIGEKWTSKTTASGSSAKGQFAFIQLEPIEGVQGPYRLTGPNREQILIILANSEHVFVDGEELQRGFDRDYVIDYNLAEITFSPTILITRFSRIRVDFEYSDQYYGRSNFNVVEQLSSKNHSFSLTFYQEKDNPSNTLGFSPSTSDLDLLRKLGNTSSGIISGVDSIGYSENSILYEAVDTLVSGVSIPIFRYSQDGDRAIYRVSFTDVGATSGSYEVAQTTANGRVYEWVGEGLGNYEPILQVPTPNKKQVSVVGSTHKLSAFETFSQELALSVYDKNLYAETASQDLMGWATKNTVTSSGRSLGSYVFSGLLSYERLSSSFSVIDRFRSVEYDRNWGYTSLADTVTRQDQILTYKAGVKRNGNNYLEVNGAHRERSQVVSGGQYEVNAAQSLGPLRLRSSWFLLRNEVPGFSSEWFRSTQEASISTRWVTPGYIFRTDRQQLAIQDSVASTLMHFTSHNVYLQSGDSLHSKFRLDFIERKDQLPLNGEFQDFTDAREVRATAGTTFGGQTIEVSGILREVHDLMLDKKDENILGKLDWKGTFWERNIRQSLVYSTANTRELKREFVFVQVPTGQGTHTWRDENEDGLQDLNEFYEAINLDEKNYIKVFTPTTEYISAFQTTLQQNLEVSMPADWGKRGGLWRSVSRVSMSANTSINQKTTSTDAEKRLLPFLTGLKDPEILYARNYFRYNFFYNRNGDGVAWETRFFESSGKSLLSGGFDLQRKRDLENTLRLSLSSVLSVRLENGWGRSSNVSDYLASRNFELDRTTWGPQLVYQPGTDFRLLLKAERRVKTTPGEVKNFSKIADYSLESTWVKSAKGSLNAGFQWLSIRFEGQASSYLGYELLEGLLPGQNQKWNVNWQQTIGKDLQLTLQYNGRKSPGAAVVHTGNMQLTAYF